MSPPETMLWIRIRGRATDRPSFRRQHAIGPYILDFYCAALRVAVEIDGEGHSGNEASAHDARRTRWLNEQGIEVLRIPARDVLNDADAVADWLLNLARTRSTEQQHPPPFTGEGDHEVVEGAAPDSAGSG